MTKLQLKQFPRTLSFFIALAALLLLQSVAVAQTDAGRIAGAVTDQNGAIVPGAVVTAKNDRTGEERVTTSTDDGNTSGSNEARTAASNARAH